MRRLTNFYQWSELGEGYATTEELFGACTVDRNGKINDAGKATLVGAEAHATSIRIYLHCRFFR